MAKSFEQRTKKDRSVLFSGLFYESNDLYGPNGLVVEDIPHTQLDLVYIVQGL